MTNVSEHAIEVLELHRDLGSSDCACAKFAGLLSLFRMNKPVDPYNTIDERMAVRRPTPQRDLVRSGPRGVSAKVRRADLMAQLDELIGENAINAYRLAWEIAQGKVTAPVRAPLANEDAHHVALIPRVEPTIAERITCVMWLAEQRNGKASRRIDLTIDDKKKGLEDFDFSALSEAELAQLENMALKAQRAAEVNVVDGEITVDVLADAGVDLG